MVKRIKLYTGFTLIELMVTLSILAILASIAFPLVQLNMQRQKEQELSTALRQIRAAIDAYKKASDEGRIKRNANDSGYPQTLDFLVDGVENIQDVKKSKIFFLRKIPRDPMLTENSSKDGGWGKRSYASTADDPKEGGDVFDIYSKSQDIGLNGVPYREW